MIYCQQPVDSSKRLLFPILCPISVDSDISILPQSLQYTKDLMGSDNDEVLDSLLSSMNISEEINNLDNWNSLFYMCYGMYATMVITFLRFSVHEATKCAKKRKITNLNRLNPHASILNKYRLISRCFFGVKGKVRYNRKA